eukprot:jgi/Botrbrau1/13115/Bobra.0187s0072.1
MRIFMMHHAIAHLLFTQRSRPVLEDALAYATYSLVVHCDTKTVGNSQVEACTTSSLKRKKNCVVYVLRPRGMLVVLR